jgi:hypothetical protein
MKRGVALLALLLLSRPAQAQTADGAVRLRESALNKLAAAVLPIPFSQVVRPQVPIPFGSAALDLPWCDEVARGRLTSLNVRLTYYFGVGISGNASGTWCGLNWTATASATGQVLYDAPTRSVRLAFAAGTARTSINLPDWFVALAWAHFFFVPPTLTVDIPMDLTPTLGSLPAMRIQGGELSVETARGPRAFPVGGHDVQVLTLDGYIELRGNLAVR